MKISRRNLKNITAKSQSKLGRLLAKFNGIGGDVGIERNGSDYYLMQKTYDQHYWTVQLRYVTVDTYHINCMCKMDIRVPVIYVDQSVDVTYSGVWSLNLVVGAAAYGNSYSRTTALNATATYITPNNTTAIGAKGYVLTNAGLIKVTIDGDSTLATKLPTAQDLVNSGSASSSILIANGGFFNPTDRVWDQYTNADLIFADNLSPNVHTLIMACSGFKNVNSSDVRFYLDAVYYTTNTMTLTGATRCKYVEPILSTESYCEYAVVVVPVGGTIVGNCGNGHGSDDQTSLSFSIDSVPVTLTDGQVRSGSLVEVFRSSNIKNQDNGSNLGSSVLTYSMRPYTGLDVDYSITWLVDSVSRLSWVAMYPFDKFFDKGANLATRTNVTLLSGDGSFKAMGNSNAAYLWDNDGVYGGMLYIKNASQLENNWLNSTGQTLSICDRIDGVINKIYLARSTDASRETVNANDVWTAHLNYRLKRFTSASSFLAKI